MTFSANESADKLQEEPPSDKKVKMRIKSKAAAKGGRS